jgi:aminoglycoside/choline kinase family phosphotransferase
LELIPRVWRHIDEAIQHPMLAEIEPLVRNGLPVPTKDTLAGFRV